jgi:3-oxoacyl-[acyl-carrier protein] reductase
MVNKRRFQNRVALITGAGSETGIGPAAARTFTSSAAKVAISSTTGRIYERAKAIETKDTTVKGYTAELMDRDQVA